MIGQAMHITDPISNIICGSGPFTEPKPIFFKGIGKDFREECSKSH
jgi:hypothetical protein